MPEHLQFADSRVLGEPFAQQLSKQPPDGALAWLTTILATHSPVAGQWGVAAALLDTPWPQIVDWLHRGGPHRLMALDTLLAYRKPAVNMSPLEQIAAPVLPQAPARAELDAALAVCLAASATPRIRAAVSAITQHADDILRGGPRGVAVADLPRLYLEPAPFKDASAILERHETVVGGMRQNLQNLLKGIL